MTRTAMMKKRGREGHYCNNRHCVSPSDAKMSWFRRGGQRAREQREWKRDTANDHASDDE